MANYTFYMYRKYVPLPGEDSRQRPLPGQTKPSNGLGDTSPGMLSN